MNAIAMIHRCFRHQHPEAFERERIDAPIAEGCYSHDAYPGETEYFQREAMGHPGAHQLGMDDAVPV